MHLDLLKSFRRPPPVHAQGPVRQIWMAKEPFPGDETPHDHQTIILEKDGVRVLCGCARFRTRAHPLFAEGMTVGEISLMSWVSFEQPFFEPPLVHADLLATAGNRFQLDLDGICEDGFQIAAHRLGDHLEDQIVVFWRAVGITRAFSAAVINGDLP